MEATAYFFPGALREPEIIIVAMSELAAQTEFRKISGRVLKPKKAHTVIIATPELQEMLRTMEMGETPRRRYEVIDSWEFPLLHHYNGGTDTSENAQQWDVEARFLNELYPHLHLEDGEDLRQRIITEMDRWERKYES